MSLRTDATGMLDRYFDWYIDRWMDWPNINKNFKESQ